MIIDFLYCTRKNLSGFDMVLVIAGILLGSDDHGGEVDGLHPVGEKGALAPHHVPSIIII